MEVVRAIGAGPDDVTAFVNAARISAGRAGRVGIINRGKRAGDAVVKESVNAFTGVLIEANNIAGVVDAESRSQQRAGVIDAGITFIGSWIWNKAIIDQSPDHSDRTEVQAHVHVIVH